MGEVKVTRGSQITLTKDVREKLGIEEGDKLNLNVIGDQVMITRKDPEAFETTGFLGKDFEASMKEMRKDSTERLKELEE